MVEEVAVGCFVDDVDAPGPVWMGGAEGGWLDAITAGGDPLLTAASTVDDPPPRAATSRFRAKNGRPG